MASFLNIQALRIRCAVIVIIRLPNHCRSAPRRSRPAPSVAGSALGSYGLGEMTVNLDRLDKWSDEDAERMFEQLDKMRLYAPGNLLDQLEFYEEVEAVLALLHSSDKPRELLLEAWLLIDYITSYLLRDALGFPLRLEEELKLLPFQFERKLDLLRKLREQEAKVLPNPKSYAAYELHPDFHSMLMEHKDLHNEFLELAIAFERTRCPKEALGLMRNDYQHSRFVPEWWFRFVSGLDDEWFHTCRRLNKARNIAAHKLKMADPEIFAIFGVASLPEFKAVIIVTIRTLLFKPGT